MKRKKLVEALREALSPAVAPPGTYARSIKIRDDLEGTETRDALAEARKVAEAARDAAQKLADDLKRVTAERDELSSAVAKLQSSLARTTERLTGAASLAGDYGKRARVAIEHALGELRQLGAVVLALPEAVAERQKLLDGIESVVAVLDDVHSTKAKDEAPASPAREPQKCANCDVRFRYAKLVKFCSDFCKSEWNREPVGKKGPFRAKAATLEELAAIESAAGSTTATDDVDDDEVIGET